MIILHETAQKGRRRDVPMARKETPMSVSVQDLESKVFEMYPEIKSHGMELSLEFDNGKDAWVVGLKKGNHALTTHLERKDAEDCLNGVKCVYLGVQISQFVKNFEP
jgi:hypothetical protein